MPLGTVAVVSAGVGTAKFDFQIDAAGREPRSPHMTFIRHLVTGRGSAWCHDEVLQLACRSSSTAETFLAMGTASVGERGGQATIDVIRSGNVAVSLRGVDYVIF